MDQAHLKIFDYILNKKAKAIKKKKMESEPKRAFDLDIHVNAEHS